MNACVSARRPLRRCAWKLGSAMAARMPTIATAIMTSINVNPRAFLFMGWPPSVAHHKGGGSGPPTGPTSGGNRTASGGRPGDSGGPGESLGKREIHVLVDPLELAHAARAQHLEPQDHVVHENLGGGSAGGDADGALAADPFGLEIVGVVHEIGLAPEVRRDLAQPVGVGAV